MTLVQEGKRLVITRNDDSGGEWRKISLAPRTASEARNDAFHMLGFTAGPSARMMLDVGWKVD